MTKKLQVADESFDYPENGDINWGEEATGWAEKVTDVLSDIIGPDDILTTEAPLVNGQLTPANINGLKFDVGRVQQIEVTGLITRTYTAPSGKPTEAESFRAEGVFDGVDFVISVDYSGNLDTGVVLDVNATGQFTYTSEDKADTDTLSIKFKGTAIVDD
jgi:hypothetical protein